ncbi:beta-defensin 116 [Marmota marmota marmota]|uniref:beta-defensin 116 n=1 Tax=Marmota marmota marmota TaxID=9994 RepID=UPI000762B312|nr:beta-defensin 116 [Marmota marmota marmota]
MSVMKPYLMTIAILLTLVQKSPGGLFRSNNKKEHWNPCELYRGGKCRDACGNDEIQYLSCLPDLKCCLKISTYLTNSDSSSSSPVTNTSSSAPS